MSISVFTMDNDKSLLHLLSYKNKYSATKEQMNLTSPKFLEINVYDEISRSGDCIKKDAYIRRLLNSIFIAIL